MQLFDGACPERSVAESKDSGQAPPLARLLPSPAARGRGLG
jgi:hypothetical protein